MDGMMTGRSVTLGLDPGKSTGYAAFLGAQMIESGVIPGGFDGFADWWDLHCIWREDLFFGRDAVGAIVVERYVPLEGFRGMDQTHSLEIQGAVRMDARGMGIPVTLQPRSHKASLFGQQFTGGKGEQERIEWLAARGLRFEAKHDMDAATHVLVAKKSDPEFWERYWA